MKKSHIEQAKKSSPYKQKNCQFIKSHLKKKMRLKMKERKHEIHSHRRSFNQNDILDQLVKEEWLEIVKENPGYVDEVFLFFFFNIFYSRKRSVSRESSESLNNIWWNKNILSVKFCITVNFWNKTCCLKMWS